MPEVVLDGSFLVRLRVPRLARVACRQVMPLLVLAVPSLERVLCRIAQLADSQPTRLPSLM